MKDNDNIDHLNLLREIQKKPDASQRDLAKNLGFSLGKLNYCIKELNKKGLVKLKNFRNQSNKIKYLRYVVTPKGIAERTKLTINFMKNILQIIQRCSVKYNYFTLWGVLNFKFHYNLFLNLPEPIEYGKSIFLYIFELNVLKILKIQ